MTDSAGVDTLCDRTRFAGPDVIWLLIPAGQQRDSPTLSDVAVPVDKADWLQLPLQLLLTVITKTLHLFITVRFL